MYWDTRGDQKLSEATENNNWLQWSIGKFRRYPLADPSSYNYTNFGMDEPLLRYADVLLMYAEAYNEVNHAPGDYRPSSGMDMSGISIQPGSITDTAMIIQPSELKYLTNGHAN